MGYPQIKLILVLPCKDQTRGWYDSDVKRYNEILSRADKVVYTAERYYDGCMLKRNRHDLDDNKLIINDLTPKYGDVLELQKGFGAYSGKIKYTLKQNYQFTYT